VLYGRKVVDRDERGRDQRTTSIQNPPGENAWSSLKIQNLRSKGYKGTVTENDSLWEAQEVISDQI